MSQADVNRAVSEAIAYRDGKGVEKDLDKAIALLRPLSEESEWASRELLTTLFMKNDRKDDVERMKLAERMSEAGDMNATIRLATCYRDGRGVEKDPYRALFYLSGCTKSTWGLKELLNTYRSMSGNYDIERFRIYEKLASVGDTSSAALRAVAYREGKGVAKDKIKALECFEGAQLNNEWSRNEYAKTAIMAGRPELLEAKDCLGIVPYAERPEAVVELAIEDGKAKVSVEGDSLLNPRIRLFCDGVQMKGEVKGLEGELQAGSEGLYYAEAEASDGTVTHRYYSHTVRVGALPAPDEAGSMPAVPSFYKYGYPYFDILLIESSRDQDVSWFVDRGLNDDVYDLGSRKVHVLHDGTKVEKNGEAHYFSGEGIVSGRFVYGHEDLGDELDDIGGSVGSFVHVVAGKEVVIESDYFGMGKIFAFRGDGVSLYSNRYHLLLLGMKILGIRISLDEGLLESFFYMSEGMLSEQSVNGEMLASGTYLEDAGVRIAIDADGAEEIPPARAESAAPSHEEYLELVSESKSDILSNLRAVMESDRFDSFCVDITGGIDSRLVLSSVKALGIGKDVFVNTSGTDEYEISCAASVASDLGFDYDADYMSYRRISGGFGLPVEGSPTTGRYLDIVASFDMGTFDSSLMPLCRYGERTMHLAGWCGEITTRSFIAKRTMRVPIYPDDDATSLSDRYVRSTSAHATAGYRKFGEEFERRLREAMSEGWRGAASATDRMYSNYRARFHDDFSRNCAYSTPAWAPLLSKRCFEAHSRTSDEHSSFKFAFDLQSEISPEASRLEYSSLLTNIERTVLLRGKLEGGDSTIVISKDMTDFFESMKSEADEMVPVVNGVDVDVGLDSLGLNAEMSSRCEGYLQALSALGVSKDLLGEALSSFKTIVSLKNRKAMYSLYKKLASAYFVARISEDDFDPSTVMFDDVPRLVYDDSNRGRLRSRPC
ncbi:MAG: sel1 repeat family protein [Candidatus Methanomethylophilaceae archaeon]|nr:sel1 repeat family protein [Candidatus Methanomethylophilaceae archaeon]